MIRLFEDHRVAESGGPHGGERVERGLILELEGLDPPPVADHQPLASTEAGELSAHLAVCRRLGADPRGSAAQELGGRVDQGGPNLGWVDGRVGAGRRSEEAVHPLVIAPGPEVAGEREVQGDGRDQREGQGPRSCGSGQPGQQPDRDVGGPHQDTDGEAVEQGPGEGDPVGQSDHARDQDPVHPEEHDRPREARENLLVCGIGGTEKGAGYQEGRSGRRQQLAGIERHLHRGKAPQ